VANRTASAAIVLLDWALLLSVTRPVVPAAKLKVPSTTHVEPLICWLTTTLVLPPL